MCVFVRACSQNCCCYLYYNISHSHIVRLEYFIVVVYSEMYETKYPTPKKNCKEMGRKICTHLLHFVLCFLSSTTVFFITIFIFQLFLYLIFFRCKRRTKKKWKLLNFYSRLAFQSLLGTYGIVQILKCIGRNATRGK